MEARVMDLHRKSIVVDAHCDTFGAIFPVELLTWGVRLFPAVRSLEERSDSGQVDLPRLIEGMIDCEVFNVTAYARKDPLQVLQCIDVVFSEMEKNSDKIAVVTKYDEILRNNVEEKVSAIVSLEGGEDIFGDLRVLRVWYRIGIRLMTLTWNRRNLLADGCGQKRSMGGLSDFGVSVVEEMNHLGMIVDIAHINDAGFWDVLEVSKDPVIVSHACCRDLCNVPRNLTDEMIKTLAEKGGVMGVTFVPSFLSRDRRATVETIVDHIEHVVSLVGADYVGLGSDFDGGGRALEDATKMPEITNELVKRGYSDMEVEKILGGNFLRVFKEVLK